MPANPKTLLIADDDRLVQAMFCAALEEKGYKVLAANDGVHAMRILAGNKVDIALLDIFMPEKDGLETILEIRRRYPETPIFVMTGGGTRTSYDYLAVAEKFGADRLIKKPILPDQLIALIESYGKEARTVA